MTTLASTSAGRGHSGIDNTLPSPLAIRDDTNLSITVLTVIVAITIHFTLTSTTTGIGNEMHTSMNMCIRITVQVSLIEMIKHITSKTPEGRSATFRV